MIRERVCGAIVVVSEAAVAHRNSIATSVRPSPPSLLEMLERYKQNWYSHPSP